MSQLCLGAHAQARYMVVCLSVCLSVSPTTFSATGYTYILCSTAGLQLLSKCHYNFTAYRIYSRYISRVYILQKTIRNFVDSGIVFWTAKTANVFTAEIYSLYNMVYGTQIPEHFYFELSISFYRYMSNRLHCFQKVLL